MNASLLSMVCQVSIESHVSCHPSTPLSRFARASTPPPSWDRPLTRAWSPFADDYALMTGGFGAYDSIYDYNRAYREATPYYIRPLDPVGGAGWAHRIRY